MTSEAWDARYRQGDHAHDPPLAFIANLLPPGEGRRALDLACGAGRHAVLMAERDWRVTAVDWSEAALELMRSRDSRIEIIRADLEASAFLIQPNHWDLICISFYMQRDLFAAIGQGLRPDGVIAAAFPMVDQRDGVKPMRREFLLAPGELRGSFEDFAIVHYEETMPTPPKRRTAELWACRQNHR